MPKETRWNSYIDKKSLCKGIKLIKNTDDSIVWLKLDKNFFSLEKDIMLAICYVTPTESTRQGEMVSDIFVQIIIR